MKESNKPDIVNQNVTRLIGLLGLLTFAAFCPLAMFTPPPNFIGL